MPIRKLEGSASSDMPSDKLSDSFVAAPAGMRFRTGWER